MKPLCWQEVPREQMNPLMVRQAIHTGHMTIARLELKKGAVVPRHQHANEQVSLVQAGLLRFRFDGQETLVAAGQALEIVPHRPHSVDVLEDSIVLDLFTPPREDWIRGDDAYLRK